MPPPVPPPSHVRPDPAPRGEAGPKAVPHNARAAVLLVVIALGLVAAGLALAPHFTRENVEGWARRAGSWGPLVLLGVQIAQILLAPIPGMFVPILAGLLYGPVVGPLITTVGTAIGSMIAYAVGRRAGRPLAARWAGEDAMRRAEGLLAGKRWIALIPLFVFPFSPADALCFLAGVLGMPWTRFAIAVAVGRIPRDAAIAAAWALGLRWIGGAGSG